ncbi:Cytochrome b561, eukaryote domain and Cytochrome b561/ferric reductase transmembrane domain and RNA-binding protein Lupus La domain and Winged helix-turn-helix DNA-binding domain-containing protein [Strongyloides ratti]|uniref:Cytochrome b561, eukaryote domain and Cytochrome b561/ferric reductase transmembrane domain and RNA-binding protein Lupus La domain and Winged helix-turn-helix DNA-binding domain-containing protein n=1 Tax=Strongyloides ratti TaxID=34506 RepID=A0A090KRS4_STRRB|nr:Cytochrome b561, eukaryote domain and Cytochrome b561/ferric reductase transmembrane domain and RNA-binding protein Lupus La domain and Winged helix-turn-helix DNA-binding domain-containing protein [Strongyloides ratti]CEF60095.2 Cytochrome b561, eukaryote domain and Cytochrome b561/ferric reductase transmembrane domain and RNA-binding protein Lupus La domain and Winged helix-turn-helix DNA-binding domain-containing protein [Strongyloides ratti]
MASYFFENKEKSYFFSTITIFIAEFIGLISFLLIFYWGYEFGGGFGWKSKPAQEFRLHPVFMSFGLLFCQGSSIMIYRLLRSLQKSTLKWLHIILHFISLICTIIGFIAAYDSHVLAKPPKPDFMSLHSWIGLSTMSLFLFQFVFSFLCYMKPGFSIGIRKSLMPFHRYFGLVIFVLTYATIMMGMSEKAAWAMTCWTVDGYFCSEIYFAIFKKKGNVPEYNDGKKENLRKNNKSKNGINNRNNVNLNNRMDNKNSGPNNYNKKMNKINQNDKLSIGYYFPLNNSKKNYTFDLPHYAKVIVNNNGIPVSRIQQINGKLSKELLESTSNNRITYHYPTLQNILNTKNNYNKNQNKKYNNNFLHTNKEQNAYYKLSNNGNSYFSKTLISTLHFQPENSNQFNIIGYIHHPVPIMVPYQPLINPQIIEHEKNIRRQVEYYFSEDNLIKDLFFRRLVLNPQTGGFVSIYQLLSFHMLYKLICHYQNPVAEIARILSTSDTVEVSPDGLMLRAKNNLHIKYAQMALSK